MDNLRRIRELIEKGKRSTALFQLAIITKESPSNVAAWRLLAELVQDSDQKKYCYRQILRYAPDDVVAKQALGNSGAKRSAADVPVTHPANTAIRPTPAASSSSPNFTIMQEVRLRTQPDRHGIVLSNLRDSAGCWQYEVFFGSERRFIAEQDLELVPQVEVAGGKLRLGNLEELLRRLALIKYQKGLAGNLYAFRASRTQFEPYQFKPALKFLNNPDQRLLIADEVGLGKTIEAGIIFLELQARLETMSRVLVVCPSSLRGKWADELRSRFDETFTILESVSHVRRFLQDYQRTNGQIPLKGIVSLELIRREDFALQLADEHVHFDLVILDEAHHCKNPETQSNYIASVLSDNADAMLFLTATPVQLGYEDLFYLFQLLLPGEFDNFDAFKLRLEPNVHINQAAKHLNRLGTPLEQKACAALGELRKVEKTAEKQRFLGNPYYAETVGLLQRPNFSVQDVLAAQRHLSDLNTLAPILTRTRKREVQTQVPERSAFTLPVCFTVEERAYYDSVINFVRQNFMQRHGIGLAPSWAVMMRERQAASCISAVRKYFDEMLAGKRAVSSEDETLLQSISDDDVDPTLPRTLDGAIRRLHQAGRQVGNTDTKFEVFVRALNEVLLERPTSKILVFSFFRGTLEYLHRRLHELKFRVVMMHGGHSVTERQLTVEDFRTKPEISILLSSEVGAEGLDFQFCDTLFNYDLPWNPMKVEQRIGRIDRFGQQADVIRIYNLVIEETIEERIFMRLYDRIQIFERAIGDLEAILGEEIRELSKRIFSTRLTPQQEEQLAEQTALKILRRKEYLEEVESQKLQFMGQGAIFESEMEQMIQSGRFVSGTEVRALVASFLRAKFPRSRLSGNGDGSYFLETDADLISYMQGFVFKSRAGDPTYEEIYKRLAEKQGRGIPVTFRDDQAYRRRPVEFITLRHPIAQAAAEYWASQPSPHLPISKIVVEAEPRYAGNYFFFVYSFDAYGLEQRTTLVPIAISAQTFEVASDLGEQFLRLIQNSAPSTEEEFQFDEGRFQQARGMAAVVAAEERNRRAEELTRSHQALVNARVTAKTQTYRINKKTIEGYIQKATEPRILRMRQAQLRNLEGKYASAMQKLKKAHDIVVDYKLELAGLARVVPPSAGRRGDQDRQTKSDGKGT